MEIKVKEVSAVEEKSVQEVEKELLEKHEKEITNEEPEPVEVVTPQEEDSPPELKEEEVLSYTSQIPSPARFSTIFFAFQKHRLLHFSSIFLTIGFLLLEQYEYLNSLRSLNKDWHISPIQVTDLRVD